MPTATGTTTLGSTDDDFGSAVEELMPKSEDWFTHASISVQNSTKSLQEMRVLLQEAKAVWDGIPADDKPVVLSHMADNFHQEITNHATWIGDILLAMEVMPTMTAPKP